MSTDANGLTHMRNENRPFRFSSMEGLPTVLFEEFCCERWRGRHGVFSGGESGVQGVVFFLEDRRLTTGFMLMGLTQWRGHTERKGLAGGRLLVDKKEWHLYVQKVPL